MSRRTGGLAGEALPGALSERFELLRRLGGSGNASVFLADDQRLGRKVAVKILAPGTADSRQHERFEREILLTSRLLHPLVVPVLDHGVDDDHHFYVMPYVEGETLRTTLARDGHLSVPEAVRIALDLCEALAYAHGAGVVHRDLKPENIFCGPSRALLADFGIATAAGSISGMRLTESGVVHGTALYMSPEQAIARHDLDARSDLYAFGCVLFEMLTGQPPFRHPNVMQLVSLHLNAPIPDLTVEGMPRGLVQLVHALLAKSRDDRPATAAEVHARLHRMRAEVLGAISRPAVTPTPSPMEAITPSMTAYHQGKRLLARGMAGGSGAAEALQIARTYFERALSLDSGNQAARLGLADVIQAFGDCGLVNAECSRRDSIDLRRSAVEQPGNSAEVHVLIGETLLYWDDDVVGAGRSFAKALAIEPGHPGALRLHGVWLNVMGRTQEAADHLRAAALMHPERADLHVALADVLVRLGRDLEALGVLRTGQRSDPRHELLLERLVRCSHRAGLHREAADARRALLREHGGAARLAAFDADLQAHGWLEARSGDLSREVTSLLQRTEAEDAFQPRGPYRQLADQLLVALADLGLWSEAMDCVEVGAGRRPGRLRVVLTDLPFDRHGLARDPRYAPLLRSAGLQDLV
ncbi:MAG: protein kinase [Gemmatimonadetes bacterium]|nr:protein kinase [Gemmatimonadota bacterium]